ncbi:amidohydrolase [Laetiporus sulphureus 93-53]|uniref:Amidohydrolase n=1 Tax=Laetiporus sulphureus 93-53 TaxID=1314785 RepID=A0A165EK33_9APHY|nr:amidohydrolase [Laetiporus sulphureus 93-53]KZT07218.1 amidohydrolase [Laetiporus sulphureus 93-53]
MMSGSDVQAGCFPVARLRPFWRRRSSAQSQSRVQEAPRIAEIPTAPTVDAAEVVRDGELPPYAHFANAGLYYEPGAHKTDVHSEKPPAYAAHALGDLFRADVMKTIEDKIDELDPELRELSLDILHHPELGWEERRTHDKLTKFMSTHGFDVIPHYLGLETAWSAVYTYKSTSAKALKEKPRVIGVNSEMDALPGIGHACGHNLIAIAGVGVALAIKAALEKHDVSGKVILLGTPAEEGGGGKISLLKRGAYKEMDACIMCHPSATPVDHAYLGPSLASQPIDVEFFGHGAHAAWAPWEAQNALDAAFLAYSSISVLRQQIKPTHRVHGIVSGKDWAPNIIPDYSKMRWIVRAPTWSEVEILRDRVKACFEAAAHATGCKLTITEGVGYKDLRQNNILGHQYANVVARYGVTTVFEEGMAASTDFGDVTYALPALHPGYSIPTVPNGANHTPQFTEAAGKAEAHKSTLITIKGLAMAGFRLLDDSAFAGEVRKAWEEQMKE